MAGGHSPDAGGREPELHRIQLDALTIRRRRQGRGFIYLDADGQRITHDATLARIRSLAVPPAYQDVRIALDVHAHLQAIGRDEAGRIQYRYHPRWDEVREAHKVGRLGELARILPRLRRRLLRDLEHPAGDRRKALAAAVMLIDLAHIRIGGENYLHSSRSRGAATLLKRNVAISGDEVCLNFLGKGGRRMECTLASTKLAAALTALQRLPGHRLFQYLDETGRRHHVTAAKVNAYLHDLAGALVTAKNFRTMAATAAAGERLAGLLPASSATGRRRQIAAVMRETAAMLGNTPAVTRKSYVHRRLLDMFEQGRLAALYAGCRAGPYRSRAESLVAALFTDKVHSRHGTGNGK